MYIIFSSVLQDFYNLVDVYLDAVFFPKCVDDFQTFQQEGWHYELNDPAEEISYKGCIVSVWICHFVPDHIGCTLRKYFLHIPRTIDNLLGWFSWNVTLCPLGFFVSMPWMINILTIIYMIFDFRCCLQWNERSIFSTW